MSDIPADIYTEPHPIDVDTLANLGPLSRMAGIWEGRRGLDVKPKAEGPKKQAYVERLELQPLDPVTNGPQLMYGLRYHQFVTKPDNIKTYHDQVGYWLGAGTGHGRDHPHADHPARPDRAGRRQRGRRRHRIRAERDGRAWTPSASVRRRSSMRLSRP